MTGRTRRNWNRTERESFRNAMEGIAYAMRNEPHMRIHLAASAVIVVVACALKLPPEDWMWLFSAIAAVWVTELLNTAVERAVDLASPGSHELAKIAKDTAAGAVLVASAYAVAIGLIVLGPPLLDWVRSL